MAGVVAYPAQGIYQTVHKAAHSRTRNSVSMMRHKQAKETLERELVSKDDVLRLTQVFDGLR